MELLLWVGICALIRNLSWQGRGCWGHWWSRAGFPFWPQLPFTEAELLGAGVHPSSLALLCGEPPLTAHVFGVPAGPGRPAFPLPHLSLGFQGDQGGLRTLQKKWTSFLKARLICSRPDSNLVFNVLRDVFVLRSPDLKEPVFYGVFTPQL